MNKTVIILILLMGAQLSAQEPWQKELYEEEAKSLFNYGTHIYSVSNVILELDHQLQYLDTMTLGGKIRYNIFTEQRKKVLEVALMSYNELIEKYPNSFYAYQSMFNKAEIHRILGQADSAKIYFTMLTKNSIESEDFNGDTVLIRANDYYLENAVYASLSEIEYKAKNYNKSIEYLTKSEEAGLYSYCGNEHEENEIYLAIHYAKSYYAMDSLEKAIEIVLPHIIDDGMSRNKELVDIAIEYFLQKFDKNFLLKEFEDGYENYTKRKPKWSGYRTIYFMEFLSTEFQLLIDPPDNIKNEKDLIMENMKNELFYKRLKGQ